MVKLPSLHKPTAGPPAQLVEDNFFVSRPKLKPSPPHPLWRRLDHRKPFLNCIQLIPSQLLISGPPRTILVVVPHRTKNTTSRMTLSLSVLSFILSPPYLTTVRQQAVECRSLLRSALSYPRGFSLPNVFAIVDPCFSRQKRSLRSFGERKTRVIECSLKEFEILNNVNLPTL